MSYKQLVKPDVDIEAKPGWCLNYVQRAFKAGWSGTTASDGWERAEHKHKGKPPKGIAVPVWFAMEGVPAGHVVVWMPDGSIWSASDNDPQADKHPNLQHLLDFYGGRLTLRGWSEDLGGTRVVKEVKGDDMVTETGLAVIYRFLLGEATSAHGKEHYLGKVTFDQAYSKVMNSARFKKKVAEAKKTKHADLNQFPEAIRKALMG